MLAIVCMLSSAPSHAYVDPATGSIILQGLLAGIAIALGVMRTYWMRFKSLFKRPGPTTPADARAEQEPDGGKTEVRSQS